MGNAYLIEIHVSSVMSMSLMDVTGDYVRSDGASWDYVRL